MAIPTSIIYQMSPLLQKTALFQRQLEIANRTFALLPNYSPEMMKSYAAASNFSTVLGIGKIIDSQTPQTLKSVQQAVNLTYMSGAIKYTQKQRAILDSIMPLNLQMYAAERIPDWSRAIYAASLFNYKSLHDKREQELSKLISIADKIVEEEYPDAPYELSENDQRIVATEIEAILHSEKNWEQRFAESVQKYTRTHPVIAWLLKNVFLPILLSIIANILYTKIGEAIVPASMYDEPKTTAQVIYHIEPNQTVVIVGDVPYYYEIEAEDAASNQVKTGYVSKRSIRICENYTDDEETAQQ